MGWNISGELQNGGAQSQKLSKIWITLDRPFWKLSKNFFSKNCYNLYLLIIFIIKIELQNVWLFSNHSNLAILWAEEICIKICEILCNYFTKSSPLTN